MPSPMPKSLLAHFRILLIVCTAIAHQSSLHAQPGHPTAVEAIALNETTVRVYWNPTPIAEKYLIYRDGMLIGSVSGEKRQFEDENAESGCAYSYRVALVDGHGTERPGQPYVERTFDALPARTTCDVLVVGATTAGVAAAVTAARYGMKVVLIEETRRI